MIYIIKDGKEHIETDRKPVVTREVRRLEKKGHEVKVDEYPKKNNASSKATHIQVT